MGFGSWFTGAQRGMGGGWAQNDSVDQYNALDPAQQEQFQTTIGRMAGQGGILGKAGSAWQERMGWGDHAQPGPAGQVAKMTGAMQGAMGAKGGPEGPYRGYGMPGKGGMQPAVMRKGLPGWQGRPRRPGMNIDAGPRAPGVPEGAMTAHGGGPQPGAAHGMPQRTGMSHNSAWGQGGPMRKAMGSTIGAMGQGQPTMRGVSGRASSYARG